MAELERLQVRIVSGRLGRKEGGADSSDETSDSDDDADVKKSKKDSSAAEEKKSKKQKKTKKAKDTDSDGDTEASGKVARRTSINASLLNAANSERGGANGLNGIDFDVFAQRRNSSLPGLGMGLSSNHKDSSSMINEVSKVENSGFGGQPTRPYVGGASACAYEAARADYYRNQSQKKDRGTARETTDNKTSGGDITSELNYVGSTNVGNMPQLGLSVNPNQHYEMLKLHHMNLLNEIQETTLMMNLYQQQQLQQQKSTSDVNMEQQLANLAQRQQVEAMQQQFQPSFFPPATGNMLGVGIGTGFGGSSSLPQFLLQQAQPQFGGMFDASGVNRMPRRLSLEQSEALFLNNNLDPARELEMAEKKIKLLKEELARKNEDRDGADGSKNKRMKNDNN